MNQDVVWPAIIKMAGVDDLLYVDSQYAWINDTSVNYQYHSEDRLVDVQGQCFQLPKKTAQTDFIALQQSIDLAQLEQWVRQHLVAMQQCCVYKVELESFDQGLCLVKDTRESD